jgi:hypothetical protein
MIVHSKPTPARPDPHHPDGGFRRRRKLSVLYELLGALDTEDCVLLTRAQTTPALFVQLRQAGGRWCWAELDATSAATVGGALGESVLAASPFRLPFADAAFDRAVVVDVQLSPGAFASLSSELRRVLRSNGVAIVHSSDDVATYGQPPRRWSRRTRRRARAMAADNRIEALERALTEAGLEPLVNTSYGGVFAELADYVHQRSAPWSSASANRTGTGDAEGKLRGTAWVPGLMLRMLGALSALDVLIDRGGGRAAALAAIKPE